MTAFDADSAFIDVFILNDSTNSERGPGVWLDTATTGFFRVPAFIPATNFPGDFFVHGRLGDLPWEVEFGITFLDANILLAYFPQFVVWETPPGEADIDNADLLMSLGTKMFGCELPICIFEAQRCRATANQWGVEPIRDGFLRTYTAPYSPCREWSPFVYLPAVDR